MGRGARPRVANRRLVKPREPHRLADLARVVLGVALLAVPPFLYAAQQAQLHQYKRSITQLEQRRDELNEIQRRLELELATLRDPQRVELLAREIVGLAPVTQDRVVFLDRPAGRSDRGTVLLAQFAEDADGPPRH